MAYRPRIPVNPLNYFALGRRIFGSQGSRSGGYNSILPLLGPGAFAGTHHSNLLCYGVPRFKGRQLRPLLLYTRQMRAKTIRKAYPQEGRQVPLEKLLRISRLASAKKKSLAKYFSLDNQFIGSLSIDLLRFRSGHFRASTTRDMKEGLSLGRPSSRT
ncbi:LOW QUALITY PROTEIN: hypothetical protein Cgig2_014906 [Carnegiea gigantea]|uniref:Uncharacterized protein n=1 Tax=Carnegiea gigantea TaxID=171969 RepID=A0A9Q1GJ80_9CARY|nr:LOW QUALITY PROTEIN: hypothetical protein Cgig2_014906 [Carnegiea gigantea]